MHRQCLNQISSAPRSPPGASAGSASTIGSVRRSIFPRRSSLSRAASSFLSTTCNKKGSASKIHEEHDHQAKFTASAAGSSPHFRRRRRPLKSCLSSSSLQSSFSTSFSSLDSSSSTSTILTDDRRPPLKSVSFDKVQVREYGITKGCTTSCIPSGGPPISLSWYYNPTETKICVNQYEKCKATRRRRTSRDLILSPREQVAMLREHGNDG